MAGWALEGLERSWLAACPTGSVGASLMETPFLAGWPILLGVTGIPAALQLLLLPFFPESPRYLLVQKKDQEAARKGEALPWEEEAAQGRSTLARGELWSTRRRPPAPRP